MLVTIYHDTVTWYSLSEWKSIHIWSKSKFTFKDQTDLPGHTSYIPAWWWDRLTNCSKQLTTSTSSLGPQYSSQLFPSSLLASLWVSVNHQDYTHTHTHTTHILTHMHSLVEVLYRLAYDLLIMNLNPLFWVNELKEIGRGMKTAGPITGILWCITHFHSPQLLCTFCLYPLCYSLIILLGVRGELLNCANGLTWG